MTNLLLLALTFTALSLALAYPNTGRFLDVDGQYADEVVVNTRLGSLICLKKQATLLSTYTSCKAIPYAEPPVASLRFRAPVSYGGWSNTLNATVHGEQCFQPGLLLGQKASGSEDCLTLNVYSPNLNGRRPVMVFIHGGVFTNGNGDTFFAGPEPLINEDVLLVTVNYRLGLLGFLSTGDRNAQGNYGLKDVLEALKWVQSNIVDFGGDPTRVTVFGQSNGAAMVHYLVLSPLASGLFSRAISQSGTALSPWAFQPNPRDVAFDVGRRLGSSASSTVELVAFLRGIEDLNEFDKVTDTFGNFKVPRGQSPFQFAPVIESIDSTEARFLAEHPLAIIEKGTFNQVPYIIGANSDEGLYGAREFIIDPFLFSKFNNNPHYVIPTTWNIDPQSREATEISDKIRNLYFTDGTLRDQYEYTVFCSDTHFHYPTYKTVQLHAAKSTLPVYYYIFGFTGIVNYAKNFLFLTDFPGAMHTDELAYMFRMLDVPAPILPGTGEYTVRARMTKMWTNFAKQSDPTPTVDGTITTRWPRVAGNQEYISLTRTMDAGTQPFSERMALWAELDQTYGPKY